MLPTLTTSQHASVIPVSGAMLAQASALEPARSSLFSLLLPSLHSLVFILTGRGFSRTGPRSPSHHGVNMGCCALMLGASAKPRGDWLGSAPASAGAGPGHEPPRACGSSQTSQTEPPMVPLISSSSLLRSFSWRSCDLL